MSNGLLAMGYYSTDEITGDDESEESETWLNMNYKDTDYGPWPPPPEFLLPPPPMPDFMLNDFEEGSCVKKSLPEHLASCDMSFASIKSTSSDYLPGGIDGGSTHFIFLFCVLGGAAVLFLALCVIIFIIWRRCRSRNRLSYLRKSGSRFETTVENTSELPLIYNESNFRAHPRLAVAHVSSYQIGRGSQESPGFHFDASTSTRSICRPDHLQIQHQTDACNDGESRIYEELYHGEDPVYSDAMLPHLSDHYYQPAAVNTPGLVSSVSRSSTLHSIKRILGLRQTPEPTQATSPLSHQFSIPVPAQFTSPGVVSADSLMLMSPDYSAVYHPLVAQQQDVGLRNFSERNQVDGRICSKMAESSFSSSSCSSGSTRPPSHNNSTTSTLPVACLSSSSCSCTSSTCQYQRNTCHNSNRRPPEFDHEAQTHYRGLPDQPELRRQVHPDQLGLPLHYAGLPAVELWQGRPVTTTYSRRETDNNNSDGFFASLWRKRRSKTSARKSSRRNRMATSATTIFRLEPGHPSYPRFMGRPDGNGNGPSAHPSVLPVSVNTCNQRFAFTSGHPVKNENSFSSHNFGGTPILNRQADCRPFYGTLGSRPQLRRKPVDVDRNDDEEVAMLLDDQVSKSTRVPGNQGVMPNPDDILPKKAWTDFSGTDDWPDLIAHGNEGKCEAELYTNLEPRSLSPSRVKARQIKDSDIGSPGSEKFVTPSPETVCANEADRQPEAEPCDDELQSASLNLPPSTFRSTKFISLSNS